MKVTIVNYTTGEVLEVDSGCAEGMLEVLEIAINWAKNGDTITIEKDNKNNLH